MFKGIKKTITIYVWQKIIKILVDIFKEGKVKQSFALEYSVNSISLGWAITIDIEAIEYSVKYLELQLHKL